jgi:L-threonylcarbamoyladenylate synthase
MSARGRSLPARARLLRHLRAGGLIAYATESCFGLGCDPRKRWGVRRLLALKRRAASKGLILVADRLVRLAPYLQPTTAAMRADFARYWPGPVSLILPAAAPAWLTGAHATLAVRVTAHPDTANLCRRLKLALVSTSANVSGASPAKTEAQCRRIFGTRVLVLPGKIGARKRPSTLIDYASGRILRA